MKIPIRTVPGFFGPSAYGAAVAVCCGNVVGAVAGPAAADKPDMAACTAARDCDIALISAAVWACAVYAKLEIAKDARISRTDFEEEKWKNIRHALFLAAAVSGFVVAAN
ncbi:MAG: hypothetical protein ACJ746_06550 [Bryobacteraceae bacterium]